MKFSMYVNNDFPFHSSTNYRNCREIMIRQQTFPRYRINKLQSLGWYVLLYVLVRAQIYEEHVQFYTSNVSFNFLWQHHPHGWFQSGSGPILRLKQNVKILKTFFLLDAQAITYFFLSDKVEWDNLDLENMKLRKINV